MKTENLPINIPQLQGLKIHSNTLEHLHNAGNPRPSSKATGFCSF